MITIHIVQPTNDRALNKLSSDITEFMPTIALKFREANNESLLKKFLAIKEPEQLAKFLKDNISKIKGIAADEVLEGVINGILNLAKRPKIIEKVKNGSKLAEYVINYTKSMKVSNPRVTNEKMKNDSADFRVSLNGKDIGFSVKDDTINGKHHSLRDVSLLKQITDTPEYKALFTSISYDKYVKSLKKNDPKFSPSDGFVNTKNYFRWISQDRTKKMQDAINANKEVFSKFMTYTFNLDNPDTLILSQSGVYTNDGKDKTHASYTMIMCRDLLKKNSDRVEVEIYSTTET